MSARHNRTAVLTPVASASQRQIEYKISKNLPANKELFTLIATPHPMASAQAQLRNDRDALQQDFKSPQQDKNTFH